MENVRSVAYVNGHKYDSLQNFKGNPAWNIRNVEKIEWEYESNHYWIEFKKGVLIRDIVSPDCNYLILIFKENEQLPAPCNCVIYNKKGEIHKIICAPNLIGEWIKEFRKSDILPGVINGGMVKKIEGKEVVTLFIQDVQEYYKTGIYYYEARIFNPLTGEFGELIEWQLPFR